MNATFNLVMDIIAQLFSAISGVMVASKKKMDLFGINILTMYSSWWRDGQRCNRLVSLPLCLEIHLCNHCINDCQLDNFNIIFSKKNN